MVDSSEWMEVASAGSGVTTDELDKRGQAYQDAYAKYEEAKLVSKKLLAEAERLEGKMIEAMEQAGKSKYIVEGVGTFYFVDKMTVTTPKTIENTRALFNYIREKHGEDFFYTTAGVNHQTLQKLYKTDFEEMVETSPDKAATFAIPGLQPPTSMRSLNLRKS
jgi:hypothetical protein